MKKLLAGLATAACLFADPPTPTEELNKQLPKWVRFSGEERIRLEGFTGGSFKPDTTDAYLLNRFRFAMKLQPLSWLKVFAQTQDARVAFKNLKPYAPPFQDTFDLRQAYLEIGDPEKAPAGLRIGRQEINFGEQRLVGSTQWLNTARTFDAARLTLRRNGYRVDLFSASVVNLTDGHFSHHQAGNDLHGIYGGIEKLVPNAVIEPYVLWRVSPRIRNESGIVSNLNEKTAGLRWVGKLPHNFDYGTEMDAQFGTLGTDKIHGYAGHWVLGYTLPKVQFTPRLLIEYNYASGDKNAKDGRRETFDQLYPTAHDRYGLADQVGWKNIKDIRAGTEFKPRKAWTAALIYHDYWLASATDALYSATSTVLARSPAGTAGTHVGQEFDAQAMYTINKSTQVGFGVGHLFPGEFLKKTTPGNAYTYPYVMFNYAF
jgi:hypothetical protein